MNSGFGKYAVVYDIKLHNRDAVTVACEEARSCQKDCKFPITGQALTPRQPPLAFEGSVEAVQTQQVQPARAVLEIMRSGTSMSFYAVAIGGAHGTPQCDPLWIDGKERANLYINGQAPPEIHGIKWRGLILDPRERTSSTSWVGDHVSTIGEKAEPPTIGQLLLTAQAPFDLDLLKIDMDSYDYDVMEAILRAGFRPKVITAEIAMVAFPPPIHIHIQYTKTYEWVGQGARHRDQQMLAGASLSAYSDLLRPLGYTLLCVDFYNVVFVQTKFVGLFGDVPTDDLEAWRAGWYDRPERLERDMQIPWINCVADINPRCQFETWMEEPDVEKRYNLILDFVRARSGGRVDATKPAAGDPRCMG
jgi:hypothetical protein